MTTKQVISHLKEEKKTDTSEKIGRQTPTGTLIEGTVVKTMGGPARSVEDHERLRHSIDRNVGFKIGQYIQTPPLLFSRDGHSLFLGDMYRGGSAFLIAGGPSFSLVDKSKLNRAGILTMGMNNAVKSFRPNLWISVDSPTHFMKSIWLDPKITKFVPFCHAEKKLWDNEKWVEMDRLVGDCPNVFYYRRNEKFNAEQFLFEDTLNWGNHSKYGGGRSVMLPALRLLFYMGIRRVFLLGVDFKMNDNYKYHFEQDRSGGSVRGNNKTYDRLKVWLSELKPQFEKYDFQVYNCNLNSNLDVFPKVDINDAIEFATLDFPSDLSKERTEGLYDREAKEKEKIKEKAKLKTTTSKIRENNDKAKANLANIEYQAKKEEYVANYEYRISKERLDKFVKDYEDGKLSMKEDDYNIHYKSMEEDLKEKEKRIKKDEKNV